MPILNTDEAALLDAYHNRSAYSAPTSQYYSLHMGTWVTTQAASGQNQLITQHQIPDGTTITIDPGETDEETATVSSSTGVGPYTHTLSGNLTNTHEVDVEVEFAPDLDSGAGMNEPADANYARIQQTLATFWGAASAGLPTSATNAAEIDFGTADALYKAGITHVGEHSALTAGTIRRIFQVATKRTPGAGDPIKVPIGSLTAELGKPGDTLSET